MSSTARATNVAWGFRDGVVHRDAGAFVQDLDAEDLAGGHGAVFIGTRQGDIEGQDLVGIAGGGQGPHVVQIAHLSIQLRGDARNGGAVVAHDGGGEQGVGRGGIERILPPDLIDVGLSGFGSSHLNNIA